MSTLAAHHRLHKDNQNVDYLSRTFASNINHNPGETEHFRLPPYNTPKPVPTQWGRRYSYGGMGPIQQANPFQNQGPSGQQKVQKGHQHFGSGLMSNLRGVTLQEQYDLTKLKKSAVRRNDELVPDPTKVDLTKQQVARPWPAEHPYSSHIPSNHLLPSYNSPDNHNANQAGPTLPAESPAAAEPPTIISKARGSMGRHEVVRVPKDSEKKPMTWPPGPSYLQILKGPNRERQWYYPTPTKLGTSNSAERATEYRLSPSTADALRDLRLSHFVSSYQRDFSGGGSCNRLVVDRYNVLTGLAGINSRIPRSLMTQMESDQLPPELISSPKTSSGMQQSEERRRNASPMEQKRSPPSSTMSRTNSPNSSKGLHFNESVQFSDGQYVQEIGLSDKQTRQRYAKTALPRSLSNEEQRYNRHHALSASTRRDLNNNESDANIFVGKLKEGDILNNMKQEWSETEMRRKFHKSHPETAPDLRRKPDLRITTNERRHHIPEADNCGAYVFHGHSYPKKFEM